MTKFIYKQLKTSIIFNDKILKTFPQRSGVRQACPPQLYPFTIVLELLASTGKAGEKSIRNKKHKIIYK